MHKPSIFKIQSIMGTFTLFTGGSPMVKHKDGTYQDQTRQEAAQILRWGRKLAWVTIIREA